MSTPGVSTSDASLRFLIDSNFYIALEPYAGNLEAGQRSAASVVRLAAEQGHTLLVHPATRDDLLQATDPGLRQQRLAELEKFPRLAEGRIPAALTSLLGEPTSGSNDHRDLRLLAALHQNAATYLITDDKRLHRRAGRAGLGERILALADALVMLEQLTPATPTPPPRVQIIAPYALDADQDIFESLRRDYDGFDEWLNTKVRTDHENRDCFVIEENVSYAALTIVKRLESDCSYSLPQPVTKIATFKVSNSYVGSKYGELLLKSLFHTANRRGTASLYVEVLPKHEGLIELLGRFGFKDESHRTGRGELVLVKRLKPPPNSEPLPALMHHITYGPPAVSISGSVFMVPIWPQWHDQLFPDAPRETSLGEQLELMTPDLSTHPWGNALRKAYLSNSPSNQLAAGDVLLFYQSRGPANVSAVGVVEATLRSADPIEIMAFVGGRTVYTPTEIADMCSSVSGVLAILFRQDRFVEPAWTLAELQAHDVVTGWPQSVTRVRAKGAQWVHERLAG